MTEPYVILLGDSHLNKFTNINTITGEIKQILFKPIYKTAKSLVENFNWLDEVGLIDKNVHNLQNVILIISIGTYDAVYKTDLEEYKKYMNEFCYKISQSTSVLTSSITVIYLKPNFGSVSEQNSSFMPISFVHRLARYVGMSYFILISHFPRLILASDDSNVRIIKSLIAPILKVNEEDRFHSKEYNLTYLSPFHPNPTQNSNTDPQPENLKLTQAQKNEMEAFIDIFGEQLTLQSYSKKFDQRIQVLNQVLNSLKTGEGFDSTNTSPNATARAVLPLLTRMFKDKVGKVFDTAAELFLFIVSDQFLQNYKDISYVVDKILPSLLIINGDTNKKLKNSAEATILRLDRMQQNTGIVVQHVLTPFTYRKKIDVRNAKQDLSRVILAQKLFEARNGQFDNNYMSIKNCVDFSVKALDHTDGQVREASIAYLAIVHKAAIASGQPPTYVRRLLPKSPEDIGRWDLLWRNVYDNLDRAEGKPTAKELADARLREVAQAEEKKKNEIQNLQDQIAELKTLQTQHAGGNHPVSSANTNNSNNRSDALVRDSGEGVKGIL